MDAMDFTSMIIKKFSITDLDLTYFVGLNQIKLNNKEFELTQLFELIEELQTSYMNSIIQIFNDKYIINQDHVFTACYYVQKAFLHNINISKKVNIELFLYLATNRQITLSIEAFGVSEINLEKKFLSFCIISPNDNITEINKTLIKNLEAEEIYLTLNDKTIEKFKRIKNYFEINDNQIMSVLKSYGLKVKDITLMNGSLDNHFLALNDLIYEKMALLSLEKVKSLS
jgi:tRNA threonylcarbamoyladenosine modification (KEOPS) complex Cgi121 subunit